MQIDADARVLVTGATGFVGSTVVRHLSQRGARIRILARDSSAAQTMVTHYDAELILGDLLNESAVRSACADTTHVLHLAAQGQYSSTKGFAVSNAADDTTHEVNVNGTKMLARCAADQPEPPKFVHLSTVAVHGDIKDHPGDENSPFAARSTYELTKLEAELWLREFSASAKLPTTILRPCAIVGPGDARLLKLFRLAARKWVPLPGNGANRYQLIHVDDCARAILLAAETTTSGSTYICGNAETLTLREILQELGSSKQRIVALPIGPVTAALRVFETICRACGLQSPWPSSRLAFFTHSRWFDTSAVQRDLGLQFEHTNQSALEVTRGWYQKKGLL